ncbi:MAG TPA: hypothetical protein VF920_06435 [Dongiaceae bacterium]
MPPVPEHDLQSILQRIREALDELAQEMRQMQWRVGKLERQYGVSASD